MRLPRTPFGVILTAVLILAGILALSAASVRLWGGKPEKIAAPASLRVEANMTPTAIASVNNLSREVLQKALSPRPGEANGRTLGEMGLAPAEAEARILKALSLHREGTSKNWVKILLKFGLWLAFLAIPFTLLRRKSMRPAVRRGLLASAVLLFGVILGTEPNPMGTVKDTVTLLGASGVIFKPRAIALTVFLLIVILANKFICGWGCHFGTLQDLLHRLNRGPRDRRGILPQWKPPFWLSNGVRLATFGLLALFAFGWALDIMEPVDPFRVFNPAHLGLAGGAAVALLLGASLFVYRPWCTFFCPFGLTGWAAEKASLWKIRLNRAACPDCSACVKVCPTHAMQHILDGKTLMADCFSCGACLEICPTDALRFGRRRAEESAAPVTVDEKDEAVAAQAAKP